MKLDLPICVGYFLLFPIAAAEVDTTQELLRRQSKDGQLVVSALYFILSGVEVDAVKVDA